ncbi:Pregnancy-associated plasma protein-A [Flavobacterium fluvii]|uniref:Pregnancy-associated plasma protein-A n=1 Tax=Flavobacterium fluvii TaxID=468056 RepID=A0A1M5LAC1_9FLAO|nr:zinc metalloprotease [Flavobacterium fluvii]SHG61926.1 Pregnancy-associated plasma protein-A [Flavobacterium fluvii]
MKKILFSAVAAMMLFSCQNEATDSTAPESGAVTRRSCASQDVLAEQLAADPTLAIRMNEIEAFTQKRIASASNYRLVDGKIEIPVVVNVLYRTEAENISLAQIQSQIDVLNKDFTANNTDFNKVPQMFSGVAANIDITFKLETSIGESGVIRRSTNKTSWGTRDAMKNAKQGGIAPTSPSTTLNIWACKIGGGILGYAQFPGGKAATDGVVIDSKYFGLSGSASAPYNLGRTATHEVGHWMNLRHIWGDSSCGNDFVTDTPVHKTANYSATAPFVSLCLPTHYEMPMNYMDYTDDDLMYMFTDGQKARMTAIFAVGGPRATIGQP